MDANRVGDTISVDGDARQRLYDARGIGRPTGDGTVELTWVEAAYLLERGDLESVDGMDATAFLETARDPQELARLCVYRDLRERGFYLATAYPPGGSVDPLDVVFEVRPRGADPTDDDVAHRVVVLRASTWFTIGALPEATLAIVDEEAEVTYATVSRLHPEGETPALPSTTVTGHIAGDRVIVENASTELYHQSMFGQPIDGPEGTLWLNLLEARYLVDTDRLNTPDVDVHDHALSVEGAQFDQRYRVYRALREAGNVPRPGLKFGTDFRVYQAIDSADDPGHSDLLVEVADPSEWLTPRMVSRAVRLANGVRKRHVYAVVEDDSIRWLALDRLRP